MAKQSILANLLTIISCIILSACSKSPAGMYFVDSRPKEVELITITQINDTLSGSLMIVTPDTHGGTKTQSYPLSGNMTSDGFLLSGKTEGVLGFFASKLQFKGKKEGRDITLSTPDASGLFVSIKFYPTTEYEFNQTLTKWREQLSISFKEGQQREVEEQAMRQMRRDEGRILSSLSNALVEDVGIISKSEIPQNIANANSSLEKMKVGVHAIESSLIKLRADASIKPMTCYQAQQKVRYDFEQRMRYHWEQSLGYSHSQFREASAMLDKRLENGSKLVAKTVADATNLENALNTRKFRENAGSFKLGDEIEALKSYQSLKSSATSQLTDLKMEANELITKAKKMMQEGQEITQEALRTANCR